MEVEVVISEMKTLHIGLSATGQPYNGLQRALMQFGEYREIHTGALNLNARILEIIQSFTPDLVFIQIQAGGILKVETIKALKATGAFVVNFTGDVRYPIPPFYYELGKHLDLTLFSNMTDVEQMRADGYNAAFLEMGIDETIYKPSLEIMPAQDIVFMGNNYGKNQFPLSQERILMVDFMRQRFGKRFGLYGSGWISADGNYNHSQPAEAAKYRGAKIAINISHFNYKDYSSDRLMRILGTGTFCACKHFPDIENRFKDWEHLRIWNTFEELAHICEYYLERENERKTIAESGRALCHNNYTFNHMIQNVVSFAKQVAA